MNAAMTAGLFSCWALGSILLSYIGQTYSFSINFIIIGFFILLTIIMPLFVKEIKIIKKTHKNCYYPSKRIQEKKYDINCGT